MRPKKRRLSPRRISPPRGGGEKAIGIFDSGVGGLTVFKALRRAAPSERLIYFGDTARLPYGSKSPEVVQRFSLEIARFLRRRDIKLLVVACNSASATALPLLERSLDIPVLGVIGPAVRAAAVASPNGRIGVIGTLATVNSGAYQRSLERIRPMKVTAKACPLLVPLVEEGWLDHPVTRQVAREYLGPMRGCRIESLILGCTHYPLIKPLLQRTVGAGVRLVDSGVEVARDVVALLGTKGLRRKGKVGGESFFVTDGAERFRRLLQRILGGRRRTVRVVRFPF